MNFKVTANTVRLARERTPTYVSPRQLVTDPPDEFTPIDIAIDECGDLYVLTREGDIYRYDHRKDSLQRLPCLWTPAVNDGNPCTESARAPVAFCVTNDTLYVADQIVGGVQAFSRSRYQTRWIATDPFENPVALVGDGRSGYVLDSGSESETEVRPGFIVTVTPGGVTAEKAVTGLADPLDFALDEEGDLYVLDQVEATDDERKPVVKRFVAAESGGTFEEHIDGVVSIPDNIDPQCIEVAADGQILLGVRTPETGETTPYRYHPETSLFERISSFNEACSTLLLRRIETTALGRGLYAITGHRDETPNGYGGELYFLSESRRNRQNAETGRYDAWAWRRLDSGVQETEWHRATMGFDSGGPRSQVRLRYHATDVAEVGEFETDLRMKAGYAERLRAANVTGLWELVELTPEQIIRLLAVQSSQTTEWLALGQQFAEERVESELEDITGIDPTFETRLRDAGITSVVELLGVDSETVAEIAETGTDAADGWLAQAGDIVDEAVGEEWTTIVDPVERVRLSDAGISRLSALLSVSPTELAELLSVSTEKTTVWLTRAKQRLDVEWERHGRSVELLNPRDALLDDANGQYLWVRIELLGSETTSPSVDSFRAYFPRQSYLRYLPRAYREDVESAAFLERFLSIFESAFVGIEEGIESVTKYLDVGGLPGEYLPWLGRWLAIDVDETWSEAVNRTRLERAPDLFKKRGTRSGLLESFRIHLADVAVPPTNWQAAMEREREWLREQVNRGWLTPEEAAAERERTTQSVSLLEYSSLSCIDVEDAKQPFLAHVDCPQCFVVYLPPSVTDDQLQAFERVAASMTPAHAVGRVVRLRPWIRLSGASHPGNTYLGVNSVLSERDFVADTSTLGADSVLQERETYAHLELRSKLDTDTVLS
ncbi:phage tail protein [Haladaptatus sp. DFWS20]|uniref:phage tail protein n=1 Tax=Haladaptatus sp. DFWS20 TaxID=3403467 RepID=UPI003EB9891D